MKPKLIVAEDHPSMRAMVISLIEHDFDLVASVASGGAAVEAATKFMPDVLILDVSMPILDGPEVARRLKAQGCDAKLVFLSLFTDVDHVTACLAAGGDAYVSKMRMGTDLIGAIKEALAGRTFVSPAQG
jgi:DNA-binding NarL/FixJ family response regulator